jgi:hypothetical protein
MGELPPAVSSAHKSDFYLLLEAQPAFCDLKTSALMAEANVNGG